MTEEEWATGTDWLTLLEAVRGAATDRRFRLFACGCCRTVEPALLDEGVRCLEAAEAYADGLAAEADLTAGREAAKRPDLTAVSPHHVGGRGWQAAQQAAVLTAWGRRADPYLAAREAVLQVRAARRWAGGWAAGREVVDLLRDVFGNPFRPPACPPDWRTPTVVAVAEAAYADRAWDRLPVLADALEEAGCDGRDVLAHLRGPGPHVRGCWALDLVLGKE